MELIMTNKNYLPALKECFNSLQFMLFKLLMSKLDRSVNDFPDCTLTNRSKLITFFPLSLIWFKNLYTL